MNKVIMFSQTTCKPCNNLKFLMGSALNVKPDKIYNIFEGDAEADVLAEKYDIMSTPVTMLIDEEGNVLKRVFGAEKVGEIVEMFENK